MMDFAERKQQLISEFNAVRDERDLLELEKTMKKILRRQNVGGGGTRNGSAVQAKPVLKKRKSAPRRKSISTGNVFVEPIEEKLDLQKIFREQNYRGPNRLRFKKLVKDLDIQEPIEQLIAGLTK